MKPNQVIADRFEIADLGRDLLGRGGMGEVYRGTDTQTGQLVAVKVLKPDIVAQNSDLIQRFTREGEALRQLDHPNIVKMVAAITQGEQYYLVMEYMPGGSLRKLLEQQGQLPIRRTLEIALDLADALTRAHRMEIIHRDIKPANVLLAEDGTPRLTDFGVAQLTSRPQLTQAGTIIGTADYLSPEACQGESLDTRTDIWSFGVLLYEMLTGRRPFSGETLMALLHTILNQPVPDLVQFRPELPDALVDLIYRMLEKDRYQRIPTVRLVGAELEMILREQAGLSTSSRPAIRRFAADLSTQMIARQHNLPLPPTPFVGREGELAELDRLLSDPAVRLLTILGLGGMGKTRLALEFASKQLERFSDGVYMVPLAPLTSAEAVVPAIAEAIGFSFYEGPAPRQQLFDFLRQKTMLLLMDNFEHLLDSASLVADILQVAPHVKILTTSRARLNLQGEQLFRLSGMDFPDWETPEDAASYSAVKLFLQSARRVRPDFELVATDLKYVARICRLVQGIPLGILLAAAWVEMLSPEEIAAEISQGLDFLASDLQDIPERQRNLRAIFDYSWNLLTEREKALFCTLSVFRSGFTREAAQEIAGAGLRELMALANKSLLHRRPTGRYEMHELLRHYAAEKLAADPTAEQDLRDRHCTYFAAAFQRWGKGLRGHRQKEALARLVAESENGRAAGEWASERRNPDWIKQALDGLVAFYAWRGRGRDGETICRLATEALASENSPAVLQLRARLLFRQSGFNLVLGQTELCEQQIRQGQALLDQAEAAGLDVRPERATELGARAAIAVRSNLEEAHRLDTQLLALRRELGDPWRLANALAALGAIAWQRSAYDEMEQCYKEDLALRQQLGDQWGTANALSRLGTLALNRQRFSEAEHLERESVALYRELGDHARLAQALGDLGATLFWLGQLEEACTVIEENLPIFEHLGRRLSLAHYSTVLGRNQMHRGDYAQARAYAGRGVELARESGANRQIAIGLSVLGGVSLAEGDEGKAQQLLQESVALYQQLGQGQELSWSLAALGIVEQRLGNQERAVQHLVVALQAVADIRAFKAMALILPAAALVLAGRGEHARALEIAALAARYPVVANSHWFAEVWRQPLDALAAELPAETVAAAESRGQARDMEETKRELLAEFAP